MDANIFSYLTHPEKFEAPIRIPALCLRGVLHVLRSDGWVFPYSHAHFADIRQGGANHVRSNLENVESITQSWCIYEAQDSPGPSLRNVPIAEYYSMLNPGPTQANGSNGSGHTSAADPLNLMRKAIDETEDAELKKVMSQVFSELTEIEKENDQFADSMNSFLQKGQEVIGTMFKSMSNHVADRRQKAILNRLGESIITMDGMEILKLNRDIRENNIRDRRIGHPTVDADAVHLSSVELRNKVEAAFAWSNCPYSSPEDFFRANPLDQLSFFSPFQKQVMQLSGLSDWLGTTRESLKSARAPQSITNDQNHLLFGLRCAVFCTADKVLLTRARFIKQWLDLPVEVLEMDDFVQFILKKVVRATKTENLKGEIPFEFNDADGHLLRTYKVEV